MDLRVDSDEFIFFITWLAEDRNWTASEIVSVVQRPNGYYKEYMEYKSE
jgi:hypothetical protein